MSDEEGFCVGCFCHNLASLYHGNEKIRSLMVQAFQIVHKTNGGIDFDEDAVSDFASQIAFDSDGLDWGPITDEEDRAEAAKEVMFRFLNMIIDDTEYLAKFSTN